MIQTKGPPGDLFVMSGFVSAQERSEIEGVIGVRKFFRIGLMRELVSMELGREVSRSAVESSARRLGYRINGFNFAVKIEGGGDGTPTDD